MKPRYDRTLRTVMWLDAFFSVGIVAAGLVASPVFAVVGVHGSARLALGVVIIVLAVLLGTFGPIYGVLLMLRMRRGDYLLPSQLRLPLPAGMKPELITRR